MKTQRTSAFKRGFTLMELMVAMAITTIIVTVLVSITSIALDTWNRSRSELRASRQAKSMIDSMARDFESLVTRKGNTNEWLSARIDPNLDKIGEKVKSTNASRLVFFTAVTDRYNGELNGPDKIPGNSDDPQGGDVSCVAYELVYKDPMGGPTPGFETFVLNRLVVDPDDAFRDMLGKADLVSTLSTIPTPPLNGPKPSPQDKKYSEQLSHSTNYLCENIYQFTLTFYVQVTDSTQTPPITKIVPVKISEGNASSFRIMGTGIVTLPADAQVASGRVSAVEISATVLSDFGIEQVRNRFKNKAPTPAELSDLLAKHSFEYSKLVQLQGM